MTIFPILIKIKVNTAKYCFNTVYCHLQKLELLILMLILANLELQLLCLWIIITRYLWVFLMSLQSLDATFDELYYRRKKNLDWNWRSRVHAIVCACHQFKYIYTLMWVTVSCGPENKYDTRWGVSWVSSVIWILLGESLCRQRGKAASVSLSSHSVSWNDAKLWAVFKKHVPCNTGQNTIL